MKDTIKKIQKMPEIRVTIKEMEKNLFCIDNMGNDEENDDSNRNSNYK